MRYAKYADDDNGRILKGMSDDGDDLRVEREVDYIVVFKHEHAACAFFNQMKISGNVVRIDRSGSAPEFPWDVIVTKVMLPSHSEITAFEDHLAAMSRPLGGKTDGWGCLLQRSVGDLTTTGSPPNRAPK